ncbi:3-dehydroquinate synthase [Metasolibacillus fluoroglycofenilyticus]|uniref:3-dehydroquinate synthase n=1 Tax=Metasolibacillus fluoroglycofenilyticus TaxID=1239396 RepID=UPI000D3C72AC|nr:3-dehydroquinate synthase [Metasolibacillus fluoroglycofenilyticus]
MNISVKTTSHTYEVMIGHRILAEAFAKYKQLFAEADQIIVLTDQHVWQAQEKYFTESSSFAFKSFIMPAGESCKSFDNYEAVQTFLLEQRCTRKSLIIAFGGGAVGDLAGFVAATYMRGIAFIQVPTTILAHDSAVGGKTAINHPLGKNMIGAFYQPQAVLYDTALLSSLPEREVLSGMAEVVKHAMISDAKWLEEMLQGDLIELPEQLLAEYLALGIRVKANIVEQDETEQSVRKYLNLGHTYGHALEAAAGYGRLAHGEAVMIGLVYCLLLSERYGQITRNFTKQFFHFAVASGYPFAAVKDYSFDELTTYLVKDKKAEYGELQFVLLQAIGEPFVQKIELAVCQEVDNELRNLIAEVVS